MYGIFLRLRYKLFHNVNHYNTYDELDYLLKYFKRYTYYFKEFKLWIFISHHLTLPESFIRQFQNRVYWKDILLSNKRFNRKFSKEFKKEF
jgi:hypothetical protein